MVRRVVLGVLGTATLMVVLGFLASVATPALQRWAAAETEFHMIDTSFYGANSFDEANKKISEGWRVTEIGHDSCGNIYVYLER
jgi:hypothetical protein